MQTDEWLGLTEFACDTNIREEFSNLNSKSSTEDWLKSFKCFEDVDWYCSFGFLCYSEHHDDGIFPSCKWTMFHHMAYHSAPIEVIKKYRETRAAVGLIDHERKMALDYVAENQNEEYRNLFRPQYKYEKINFDKIQNLEKHFHKLILYVLKDYNVKMDKLVLPQLLTFLEKNVKDEIHLEIPGMLGGFNTTFKLSEDGKEVVELLICSFCRVIGGSEQTHSVAEDGYLFLHGED